MQVTGYKLREALRRWQLRRETAAVQFPETLKVFPGEEKAKPEEMAAIVEKAERAIAALQTAQLRYNGAVNVPYKGSEIPLITAIKLCGALGRVEKLWRLAATGKRDKYAHYRSDDPTRIKEGEIFAKRAISPEEAAAHVAFMGAELGALREAISIGNASSKDIKDLDASLFE